MRRLHLVLSIVAAMVVAVPVAQADGPPAIDQYVESAPTADGHTPQRTTHTALPKQARAALARSGGSDAPALEQIATSSRYGAPARKLRPPHDAVRPLQPTTAPSTLSALGAVGITGGGSSSTAWLVLVLAATAVAAGVAALRQRR